MIALTAQDIEFLHHRGSNEEDVLRQFHYFETGFPFAQLECAAAIGNGILKIADADRDDLVARYDQLTAGKSLLKFVPASGAASRMFKEAYSFLDGGDSVREAAIGMLHTLPHLAPAEKALCHSLLAGTYAQVLHNRNQNRFNTSHIP